MMPRDTRALYYGISHYGGPTLGSGAPSLPIPLMVRLAQVPQAGEIELPFFPRADVRGVEGRGEIVMAEAGKKMETWNVMETPSSWIFMSSPWTYVIILDRSKNSINHNLLPWSPQELVGHAQNHEVGNCSRVAVSKLRLVMICNWYDI